MDEFYDSSLESDSTLIFGRKGSGKTSLAFRYLLNRATPQPLNDSPAVCTFIFDYKREAARRLGLPLVGTAAQCEASLATRWSCFYPRIAFTPLPGENLDMADQRAFCWWCNWVFGVARRGPGRKVVYVDEMRRFVPSRSDLIPLEVDQIFREGRDVGIETVLSTQYPRDYAKTIREEVTEWICFNINEPDNLDAVRPYFRGVDRVTALAPGQFIAYDRNTGAEMAGRVF